MWPQLTAVTEPDGASEEFKYSYLSKDVAPTLVFGFFVSRLDL